MINFKSIVHKQTLAKFRFAKTVKNTGVRFDEYCDYFYGNMETAQPVTESRLFGKSIKRNNTFWFVQNVEELFVDEVYKFKSSNKSPMILDCGANIGLSIIYFKRLFPKAKITAFEPDSAIFNICKDNIDAFSLENVQLINAAVWKADDILTFQADNSLGGKIIDKNSSSDNSIKVKAVRLKDYINQEIDFLKIDIEGSEDEVIFDCREQLFLVKNLFIEYHSALAKPQVLQDLLVVIKEAGFRYYIKSAWNTMNHPFIDFSKIDYQAFDMQLNIFAYRI